jgi:signal transduction histidine kinase
MQMCASYRRKVFLRRYLMPLAVGAAIFAADHVIDGFLERLHLPLGVSGSDDVFLALLVAGIVYVLQQRFEIASAQMQNFASDVAHQLRTPLAIQQSVGELGLHRRMSADQYQDTIESMLQETDRLTRLVDALLLIAQMDSGEVRLAFTRIRISGFVREVATELEVLAQDKFQKFSIDAGDDALVEVDQAMFRQVLMNLLSNAIKYTPEGGAIAVKTHRLSTQRMEIIVSDNGPGIHPEERDRVFERFYRSVTNQKGTGLGLAISKWIVEAHKGTIFCDGVLGEGCRFTVSLPIRETF